MASAPWDGGTLNRRVATGLVRQATAPCTPTDCITQLARSGIGIGSHRQVSHGVHSTRSFADGLTLRLYGHLWRGHTVSAAGLAGCHQAVLRACSSPSGRCCRRPQGWRERQLCAAVLRHPTRCTMRQTAAWAAETLGKCLSEVQPVRSLRRCAIPPAQVPTYVRSHPVGRTTACWGQAAFRAR